MSTRKEEFKAVVKAQLDELQRRIAELEALAETNPSHEHAISYNTVASEARTKHEETRRRLHLLDDHGDDWIAHGEQVRKLVKDIDRTVRHAGRDST